MRSMFLIPVTLAALAVVGGLGCGQKEDDGTAQVENTQQVSEAEAFCDEHQIAEAQCPFCNPGLIESMGQCPGHGVPEALCYQCNAALVPAFKAVGDWCAGHGRPESQCYICNPELDPNRISDSQEKSHLPAPNEGSGLEGPTTASHLPRTQKAPVVFCTTNSLIVRLEHPGIAREAGLELATVESRPISKTLECNAVVAYDQNRYAQLASQVPGVIATVQKDLGEDVSPGDVMATVRSAHLGAAKSAYLQALAGARLQENNHSRESSLLERGFSTERKVLETETSLAESRIALSAAEQELSSLGLSTEQIEEVARTGDTSALYTVTASFPGIVVDRHAVVGEVVDASDPLFAVADVSRMWALLDVYESDVREIRPGQSVVLRVEGLSGENFAGYITWVSAQMDPQTRTLQARAELDNSRRSLRANMFAKALVSVRDRHECVVVPQSSVQWEGCCNVVFVKKSETEYEPRKVHLGSSTGVMYEVLSGVEAGEEIVTQGSFLLKTEILKGSIGAGCCEVVAGT